MSTEDGTRPDDLTDHDDTQQLHPTRHDDTQQLPTTTENLMDTERVISPVTAPSTGSSPADTTDSASGTSASPTTASPTAPDPVWAAATAEPRGVRVGTVVWGLVIAAVGVGLLAFASGVVFDVELALIGLVAAAGVALLVGSLVSTRRRQGR